VVVLSMARLDALAVAIAETEVDRVDEPGAGDGTMVADADLGAVLLARLLFQAKTSRFSSAESSL